MVTGTSIGRPGLERLLDGRMLIDIDFTICELHDDTMQGASYGDTRVVGSHRLLTITGRLTRVPGRCSWQHVFRHTLGRLRALPTPR